jgi:hypothetical protein
MARTPFVRTFVVPAVHANSDGVAYDQLFLHQPASGAITRTFDCS